MPVSRQSGTVVMDEADFSNAAKHGFEFELVGKSAKGTGQDACHCVSKSA
jgi:hypothetical protein